MYDTIIIGAGPTGLTAAIYAGRRMMKTLVISKIIGGQVIWASEVENFPGYKSIRGIELMQNLSQQAKDAGAEILSAEVISITKDTTGGFIVKTAEQSYISKTVIIAMGLVPRHLNLPNETELTGKGISYCANCDGPFFRNKTVAIIGGGNAALDAAEVMSKIASKVYIVQLLENFNGFEYMVKKVTANPQVEVMLNTEVKEILGREKLEKIVVRNIKDNKISELSIDGLFIEIGHEPKTELVKNLVKTDDKGQIITDAGGRTSQEGIFAAGDVTQIEFKQIIIGCGQGAVAALSAYKYLQQKK